MRSISELLEDIKTKGTGESSGLVADAAPVSETQSVSQTFTFYEHEAFLKDHLVFGKPALMGVVYPCLVLEASGASHSGTYPAELKDIRFTGGPVTLEPERPHRLTFHLRQKRVPNALPQVALSPVKKAGRRVPKEK
ncbi:hypothetical protein QNN00_13210 [Bacillus velezensis]|nr:hypothetical protein [Bacillus velezensis]